MYSKIIFSSVGCFVVSMEALTEGDSSEVVVGKWRAQYWLDVGHVRVWEAEMENERCCRCDIYQSIQVECNLHVWPAGARLSQPGGQQQPRMSTDTKALKLTVPFLWTLLPAIKPAKVLAMIRSTGKLHTEFLCKCILTDTFI